MRYLLYTLPLLFLALFLFYPLGRILGVGLGPLLAGGIGENLGRLIAQTDLIHLLTFTTGQALLSTALTLIVGLPPAYLFARYDFPGKGLLRSLLGIPFILPTVVVGSAFVTLFGPSGFLSGILSELLSALFWLTGGAIGPAPAGITLVRTLPAVILAHVFYNVFVVVRVVGGFWGNLDPRLTEAAQVLGARRGKVFWYVTLPLLTPAILAAGLLIFAFCFTSFGVILILGGPGMTTLEVAIYQEAVYQFNLPGAAFLSLVQVVCTGVIFWLYAGWQARVSLPLNLKPTRVTQRRPAGRGEKLALGLILGGLTVGLFLPLLGLAVGSLITPTGPGLDYWQALFQNTRHTLFYAPPLLAIRNSLLFAVATAGLSLTIGIPATYLIAPYRQSYPGSPPLISQPAPPPAADARSSIPHPFSPAHLIELAFLLPLGVSAVTLGFGFLIGLDWGWPGSSLDLRTSPLLMPIAHTLVALPLVIRSLLPAMRSLNPGWREAAATLGASRWRVGWEIDRPILTPALLTAAAFAFCVSLGEFGATALLARPDLPTLPVVIFSYLGQPGDLNRGQALAMSTLLMLVCVVVLEGGELLSQWQRFSKF